MLSALHPCEHSVLPSVFIVAVLEDVARRGFGLCLPMTTTLGSPSCLLAVGTRASALLILGLGEQDGASVGPAPKWPSSAGRHAPLLWRRWTRPTPLSPAPPKPFRVEYARLATRQAPLPSEETLDEATSCAAFAVPDVGPRSSLGAAHPGRELGWVLLLLSVALSSHPVHAVGVTATLPAALGGPGCYLICPTGGTRQGENPTLLKRLIIPC